MRLSVVLLCLFLCCSYVFGSNSLNIEYILDASNSMNDVLPSGEKKIEAAKKVLCNLIDNIAAEAGGTVNLGLRIYGANFNPAETKEKACADSVLVVPMNGINAALLKQKINNTSAAGFTPIAYSLELAGKDFMSAKENTNIIVLVSDGQETCGGDPVSVAKKLVEQGFTIKIHTIGFAVDTETRKQLEDIAKATGGNYYNAEDSAQLTASLEEIKKRSLEEYESSGKAVKPADNLGQAPEIIEGEYKDSLSMQEAKFYKVKAYKGQIIKASLIVKKTPYDASNSVINQTFSVKIFNDLGKDVAAQAMIIEGNPTDVSSFKAEWTADKTGWVYIVVTASKNHDSNGDPTALYPADSIPAPSPYTLKVNIKGEKPEGVDETVFSAYTSKQLSGATGFEKAVSISPKQFITDSIYMKETRFYKMSVNKGEKRARVTAVVRKPWYQANNSVINMTYILKICDEDWVEIASDSLVINKNPSEPFSLSASADVGTNEELYISLTASDNHGVSGQKDLVGIYPKDFKPEAVKYTIVAEIE